MANNYGVRYITADQFVRYCADLNVETDNRELEHYEKIGIMLPVARLVYPEDYIRLRTLWSLGVRSELPNQDQWPELTRLFDNPRFLPEQYADLHDDELIDSFDREMGKTPYLIRPTPETYKPWDSYSVLVPYQDGHLLSRSTADHYYSYWQVHQLYYLQQYPDLYKNKFLLDHVPDEIKQRSFRPWAPNQDTLREFKGLARMFDALSFWITLYNRERNRTFALVPEEHQVRHLGESQHKAYQDRLTADAKLVPARYGITSDEYYEFLYQLNELYKDYQKKERYRLSEELRNDIIYQAQLIEAIKGSDWEAIAEELGRRYTSWTKQNFRHLDILTKERDEARGLLILYAGKYGDTLDKLNILGPKRAFSATEIDELMDYCEREGLSVLLTALSGMIATQEEHEKKFRRVSLYTNLKNALTALEFLLKKFAQNGGILIDMKTLNPTIQNVMKNETWNFLFVEKTKKGLTRAKDSAEFFAKLNELVHDMDLVQSEDTYWARVFLIASLARNLTVHAYPDYDWFYGELFGEMLLAAIYAILYSWQVAKREGWT